MRFCSLVVFACPTRLYPNLPVSSPNDDGPLQINAGAIMLMVHDFESMAEITFLALRDPDLTTSVHSILLQPFNRNSQTTIIAQGQHLRLDAHVFIVSR